MEVGITWELLVQLPLLLLLLSLHVLYDLEVDVLGGAAPLGLLLLRLPAPPSLPPPASLVPSPPPTATSVLCPASSTAGHSSLTD